MEPQVPLRENEGQSSEDQTVCAEANQSGLCANTIVYTIDGELRAQDIAPGDRIITRDTGMVVLKDVRRKRVRCEAILIKAGSLGHNRPDEDVLVPVGTKLLVRDWRAQALYSSVQKLVPVEELVDGEFVTRLAAQDYDLVEFIFDVPHVIYAGGLEIGC